MKTEIPEGWTEVVFDPGDHLVDFFPGRGATLSTRLIFWLAENCGIDGEDYTAHLDRTRWDGGNAHYKVVVCFQDKTKALLCRLTL